jgi:hypothetical protein
MTITLKIYDGTAPATLLAEVTTANNRRWLHQLNDSGVGQFNLHANDAALTANPDLLAYGNIARFAEDATDRFAFLIEDRDIAPAGPGEEIDRDWAVSGRGVLALLEDAVVYPETALVANTSRQRRFDFTAIAYDDTTWVAATEIQRQDAGTPFTRYNGYPGGWPDGAAYWIWSQALSPPGPTGTHPAGTSYFRKQFTLASASDIAIFASGDNGFRLWLDGEIILEGTEDLYVWQRTYRINLVLQAGTHQLVAEGTNKPKADGYSGPGGVLVSVMEIDVTAAPTGVVFARTNNTWKALDYPADVPGMGLGTILRILVEEAQVRGALTGITLGFADLTDSKGAAWSQDPDIALDIGTSLLDVVETFVEQFIDIEMTPALELRAYNKGTLGDDLTGSVTLEIGTHFEDLRSDGQGHLTNSVLARDNTGLLTVKEDAASLAARKRREVYVELATAPTEPRAQLISDEILVEFAAPSIQVTGKVVKDSGVYTTWGPGDMVTAPDSRGDPTATNIVSIAVEEDEAGNPIYSIEAMQTDAAP